LAGTRAGGHTEIVIRIDRFLVGGLGLGAVLAALNCLRSADAHFASQLERPDDPRKPAAIAKDSKPTDPSSAKSDIAAFLIALDKLRRNDESVEPELRELSERLCKLHDRCEGKELVAYYTSLTPAQRAKGIEEEARFAALRQQVVGAETADLPPEKWRAIRSSVMDGVRELLPAPDFGGDCVPGAKALSFTALLEVDWIERDPELPSEERDRMFADAETKSLRSIELFRRAGMLGSQLEPKWVLGRLETVRDNPDAARAIFVECLRLARHVNNLEFAEHSIEGLIAQAQQAGDLDEVERLARELACFRSPAESWVLARAQAEVLLERDQAERAVEWLSRNEPVGPKNRAEWDVLLGSALLRMGRHEDAMQHYSSAPSSTGNYRRQLAVASLQLRDGDAAAAAKGLQELASWPDLPPRARMWVEALRGDALTRLQRFNEAIPVLGTALNLARGVQWKLEGGEGPNEQAISVVGETLGLHPLALLADAYARTGQSLKAARTIEAYQTIDLQFELSGAGKLQARDHEAALLRDEDILDWARSFELGLVTWVVGSDSSVVAYVSSDGHATAEPISRGKKSLDLAVRRAREACLANEGSTLVRLLAEIRAELIPDSILRQIRSNERGGRGRLLFLLHGPLERLPVELFSLLGAPFEDRITPVVMPGLPERSPTAGPAFSAAAPWTILGNPVGENGSPLLPGAQDEIIEIAGLHPHSVSYVGASFDRRAVHAALIGNAAVHFATHLKSGCARDGGRLANVGLELSMGDSFCAADVLDARPALPLVVIDACESAGGRFVEGEGLQGMARAFLDSGTRNLIVTLWPVEDRVARTFAVSLHRALIEGKSPSLAVASARDELRREGAMPADWGAFRAIARD
jgi:tetratricopeptide (TPR) repeat protein